MRLQQVAAHAQQLQHNVQDVAPSANFPNFNLAKQKP